MHYKDHPLREDAFYTNLYRRHAPGLFAYVYRQTASREDAEDIVLEVFLMVLRQPDFATFDAQKQVAWLWTITRHKVVDRFRMSARQQDVPLDGLADTLYEDDELSPEREHLKREEYAQLHRAINALPEEQLAVLHLRFGGGLRCAEIALVLNKSEGAVRTLLYRAIRTLRDRYPWAGQKGQVTQRKGEKLRVMMVTSGAEAVSWLLFDSGRGFCNYFATAMAVMARELGMPARVVIGYTGAPTTPKRMTGWYTTQMRTPGHRSTLRAMAGSTLSHHQVFHRFHVHLRRMARSSAVFSTMNSRAEKSSDERPNRLLTIDA